MKKIIAKIKNAIRYKAVTLYQFMEYVPFSHDFEVLIDVYDPEEKCYTDVDTIYKSVTAETGDYAKLMKKFGKNKISCFWADEADKITITIMPTRKQEKTWYDNEYMRDDGVKVY